MDKKQRVSIIVPVYNEGEILREFYKKVKEVIENVNDFLVNYERVFYYYSCS